MMQSHQITTCIFQFLKCNKDFGRSELYKATGYCPLAHSAN